MSGQAFRIFRLSSLAQTIKAFMGRFMWGLFSLSLLGVGCRIIFALSPPLSLKFGSGAPHTAKKKKSKIVPKKSVPTQLPRPLINRVGNLLRTAICLVRNSELCHIYKTFDLESSTRIICDKFKWRRHPKWHGMLIECQNNIENRRVALFFFWFIISLNQSMCFDSRTHSWTDWQLVHIPITSNNCQYAQKVVT